MEPVIEGPFDEIINSVSKVVLSNVHLLDDDDLELWIRFEEATEGLEEALINDSGPVGNPNILLAERYMSFKAFIDSSTDSYKKYRRLYTKR